MDARTGLFTTGLCKGKAAPKGGPVYRLREIGREEGMAGLFRGWQPTMARAAMITMGLTVSCARHSHLGFPASPGPYPQEETGAQMIRRRRCASSATGSARASSCTCSRLS